MVTVADWYAYGVTRAVFEHKAQSDEATQAIIREQELVIKPLPPHLVLYV